VTKIALTVGAYEARSIIADAQQCVNLFAEANPKDSPFPMTFYPTPGTRFLTTAPVVGPVRVTYTASNGNFYVVVSNKVYTVNTAYGWTLLGTITSFTGFISIKDNSLCCVIVDGSSSGWVINLADNSFGTISATNFFGANTVDYLDTYLIFNRPNTREFYFTYSNATYAMFVGGGAFDPLDIIAKTGGVDNIVGLKVMHRELWTIGSETSEIFFDSGGADIAFQTMPGAFVEHGCTAAGSIAKYDLANYWLGQDQAGTSVVFRGAQYQVTRISTHAIEKEISSYSQQEDAIAFIYEQEGHVFYVLTFPTANATWVFDIIEEHWHKRAWMDSDGNLTRWRPNCFATFNNQLVVGDYQSGNLYALDLDYYLDDGDPILRVRSFPHITSENDRLMHRSLIAAMEVGDEMDTSTSDESQASLSWSDDAGRSFNTPVQQSFGETGEYLTSMKWNRLGLARDRVYKLAWTAPMKTSLQGVYLDVIKSAT